MSNAEKQLPDKPSELIRLAVKDLKMVESMPEKYGINMSLWCLEENDKCTVCMAGAVMKMELDASVLEMAILGEDNYWKLLAINKLRMGHVWKALEYLLLEETHKYNRQVMSYHQGKEAFYTGMEQLACDLEKDGL